jgi:hypothetical protein
MKIELEIHSSFLKNSGGKMKTFLKFVVPAVMLGVLITPMAAMAIPNGQANVNARLHRQHARIEAGVRNHDLNRREASRLQARDNSIHRQERFDRSRQNGRLTSYERRNLNRRLNHTSGAIYSRKHQGM